MKKCEYPKKIIEYNTSPQEIRREIIHLHLHCAYYSQVNEECGCPYDECTMK